MHRSHLLEEVIFFSSKYKFSVTWNTHTLAFEFHPTPSPAHPHGVFIFMCERSVALDWIGDKNILEVLSVLQRTVESTASQTWEEFWLENIRCRFEFNETFELGEQFSRASSRIHAVNPSFGTLCCGDEQSSFHCVLMWLSDSSRRSGCLSLPAYYASCG